MNLEPVQNWIVTEDGLGGAIAELRLWSARRAFDGVVVRERSLEEEREPDWRRLLLAASVLAEGESAIHLETALMVSQAAI